jgi:hypothetical protein
VLAWNLVLNPTLTYRDVKRSTSSYPTPMDNKQREELRKLFPKLSEEELEIAAERLDRYLSLAWEIFLAQQENQSGK